MENVLLHTLLNQQSSISLESKLASKNLAGPNRGGFFFEKKLSKKNLPQDSIVHVYRRVSMIT